MKHIKRILSSALAALLAYMIFAGAFEVANAAVIPVGISVDAYNSGTLNFHWDQLPGIKAVAINYHTPDNSNVGQLQTIVLKQTTNTATLSGLESDYIYDLNVSLYSTVDTGGNPTGSPAGEGLLFYIPQITFNSSPIDVPPEDISGGGEQSGNYPRLSLKWKIPRVYDSGDFVLSNTPAALQYMQAQLDAVYNDGRVLNTMNFRINISSDLNLLNSGSSQTSLIISQQTNGTYTVNLSSSSVTAVADTPDAFDYMSFQLWGHSTAGSATDFFTQTEQADPTFTKPGDALIDGDILPGSVYYMNIKPIYLNSSTPPAM